MELCIDGRVYIKSSCLDSSAMHLSSTSALKPERRGGTWVKVLVCILLLFSLVVVVISPEARGRLSPERIRGFVSGFGLAAPVAYMGVYILLSVLFFPATILTVAGGLIFGVILGTVYTIVAATIAAALAFVIARWIGRDAAQKWLGERLKGLESRISGIGFWNMVTLRLLFLPYIPLSYIAGLTRMRLWDFVLATFLTDIPGSFAFAFLGASLAKPGSWIWAAMYIAVVLCIPLAVRQWKKRIPTIL